MLIHIVSSFKLKDEFSIFQSYSPSSPIGRPLEN